MKSQFVSRQGRAFPALRSLNRLWDQIVHLAPVLYSNENNRQGVSGSSGFQFKSMMS